MGNKALFSKNKETGEWDFRTGTEDIMADIETYKEAAKDKNIDIPEDDLKPKPSLLNRLLGVLSFAETAPAVNEYQKTGDVGKAAQAYLGSAAKRLTLQGTEGDATYSDVLQNEGFDDDVYTKGAGLAGDIFLDPTTYLGVGLIPKVAKLLKLGKLVEPGLKVASKVASKVPGGLKTVEALTKAKNVAEEAFVPFAKTKRLTDIKGGSGADFIEKELLPYIKGTRAEQRQALEEFGKVSNKALTSIEGKPTKDTGKLLAEMFQKGETPKGTEDLFTYTKKELANSFKNEKDRDLISSELEDYFPRVLTPEAREFFKDSKSASTAISDTLKKIGLRSSKERKIGLEGSVGEINKIWEEGYGFKLYDEDFFRAVATRKIDSIAKVRAYDFNKNFLDNFGYTEDEIMKLPQMESRLRARKIIEEKFGAAAEAGDAGAKEALSKLDEAVDINGVKYVPFKPEGELNFFPAEITKASGETTTIAGVGKNTKTVWIPQAIQKDLQRASGILSDDDATKGILKTYDKLTSLWKSNVTGYFPAFHGRNMLGGIFNNTVAGVENPYRYIQANSLLSGRPGSVMVQGTKYSYKDLKDILVKRGILGEQGYLDVAETVGDKLNAVIKKGDKKALLSKAAQAPRVVTEAIESHLRTTLFLNELKKGKSIHEAAQSTFKFHFDYAPEGITPFEKNVMKRLFPFYRWMRGNAPLQLQMMAERPGFYSKIGKFARTGRGNNPEEQEDINALPSYTREGTPVKWGSTKTNDAGDRISNFLYGFGLPIEDVGNMSSLPDILSRLNPVLKAPLEIGAKRNFYFDRPLEEVDQAPKIIQKAPGFMKGLVGYTEVKREDGKTVAKVDPVKWNILSSMFGRHFYTVEKLADPDVQDAVKVMYGLFGIKGQAVNIDQQKYYRAKEERDKLGEFLKGKGVLGEYSKYYVPKAKE